MTAIRWAGILRDLGHRVSVSQEYRGERCDVLIALHARRSAESVARFRSERPEAAVVLALTGTDLYRDIRTDEAAQRSMEWADRLVVLQPEGVLEIPQPMRDRARVIYQSVRLPPALAQVRTVATLSRGRREFRVCVLGHLRDEKDPFRTAEAARLLPAGSRIRVVHVGAALTVEMKERARNEERANVRYRWLGEMPRWKALRALVHSDLMSLTSVMEGGANAVSEALAAAVPIVASRISGTVGLLGSDYPGYFPVEDTAALTALLSRAESDPAFYDALVAACRSRAHLIDPDSERRAWRALLAEVCGPRS